MFGSTGLSKPLIITIFGSALKRLSMKKKNYYLWILPEYSNPKIYTMYLRKASYAPFAIIISAQ